MNVERRPGGHRDGGRDRGRSAAETNSRRLTDPELLVEVWRVVDAAVVPCRRGRIPGVGTSAWWRAPDDVKVAGLLVLAEAYMLADPERAVRERFKSMAVDLSAATSWTERARQHLSHAQLESRRAGAA